MKTKEELVALATKVREGKTTPEETVLFFDELQKHVADLNDYLSTLPKI